MPGCDSPRCRSSCDARAHRPPYRIDSLKSVRPTTIPLVDYRCCGARHNRRSIAWGKTDMTMEATRVSTSAYLLLSLVRPCLKNQRYQLQPAVLSATNLSRWQDTTPQDSRARRAKRGGIPICLCRAFLAYLALHAARSMTVGDFFSILLASIAQLEQ